MMCFFRLLTLTHPHTALVCKVLVGEMGWVAHEHSVLSLPLFIDLHFFI